MPKITLICPSQWTNQVLSINIYIDDIQVGSISVGETKQFEVTRAKHKVSVKNNWIGSLPLEVDMRSNESRTIKISNSKYARLTVMGLGLFVGIIYSFIKNYFKFEPNFIINLLIAISFAALLILPYYRYYFLKLDEVGVVNNELKIEGAGCRHN